MSTHLLAAAPVSGHVFRVERKRGPALRGWGAAPQRAAPGARAALLFDRRMQATDWPFAVGGCPPEHVL